MAYVTTYRFVACVAVVFLLHGSNDCTVDAINCYHCKGDSCKDPFNKGAQGIQTMPCDGSCAKMKKDGEVLRMCMPGKNKNACSEETSGGHSGEICQCSTDLCNTSTMPHAHLTVAIGVLVAAKLVQYFSMQ